MVPHLLGLTMKVSAKSSSTRHIFLINTSKDKKQDTWEAGATELKIATASQWGKKKKLPKTNKKTHPHKKPCCIVARLSGKRRVPGFFPEQRKPNDSENEAVNLHSNPYF